MPRIHASAGRIFGLLVSIALVAPRASAGAQAPGFVQIMQPAPGEAISGLVTIYGTAHHPAFVAYDLAFAYADNPTDTWFPLGEPVNLPVIDGRLGLWDTSQIADGDYMLRLRLWLKDGTSLEDIVTGIRVRNQAPAETSTPIPAATLAPPPTPSPTSPLPPTPLAPGGPSHTSRAVGALATGVLAALLGIGLLALYTLTRSALRPRWADLRLRYFRWQDRRRRTRRRFR